MRKLLYFYVLLLLVSACKHEPYIAPLPDECRFKGKPWLSFAKDTCKVLPPEPAGGPNYVNPKYIYGGAVFNPVNSDEIIYQKTKFPVFPTPALTELWKINLCTGVKNKIGDIGSVISMNKRDWIAGVDMYNNIFIVKTNGDSLRYLVTGQNAAYPYWFPDGNALFLLLASQRNNNSTK